MIIDKITDGYVTQTFDTETGQLLRSEFTAGAVCYYEDTATNGIVNDTKLTDDLYHPFEMRVNYLELGDDVIVDSNKADNGLVEHDFSGTLKEISQTKNGIVGTVADQDDNYYTVNLKSLRPTKYGD